MELHGSEGERYAGALEVLLIKQSYTFPTQMGCLRWSRQPELNVCTFSSALRF